MGIRLSIGDWIVGTTTKIRGSKLLYAVQISEILSFDNYYLDARFQNKKPEIKGNWQQRVGDNMYYEDKNGNWRQHSTLYHRQEEIIRKDLKHPYVFIGRKFYYFGKNAVEFPAEFESLIWNRQGCKINHEVKVAKNFIEWLQGKHKLGIHGNPLDNKEANA